MKKFIFTFVILLSSIIANAQVSGGGIGYFYDYRSGGKTPYVSCVLYNVGIDYAIFPDVDIFGTEVYDGEKYHVHEKSPNFINIKYYFMLNDDLGIAPNIGYLWNNQHEESYYYGYYRPSWCLCGRHSEYGQIKCDDAIDYTISRINIGISLFYKFLEIKVSNNYIGIGLHYLFDVYNWPY